MDMKAKYIIYSAEVAEPVPDYRKNCFYQHFEDGLHGMVKQTKKENAITVEEHIDSLDYAPARIALVDDRENLQKISSMADLKHDPYMYMPYQEYLVGMGGVWDWEFKDSKLVATDNKDLDVLIIRVMPQIGMPFEEEFKKHCASYVWEFDMTKYQAIVYYYHTTRGMSFGNIARCLGKAPQNVNSMFRVAEQKFQIEMERSGGREKKIFRSAGGEE